MAQKPTTKKSQKSGAKKTEAKAVTETAVIVAPEMIVVDEPAVEQTVVEEKPKMTAAQYKKMYLERVTRIGTYFYVNNEKDSDYIKKWEKFIEQVKKDNGGTLPPLTHIIRNIVAEKIGAKLLE